MKLIQANIWGGRLEPQILHFIHEQQPDVICLQEVIHVQGGRSALFANLEDIQEAAGLAHAFMSPVFSLKYMNRKADFGNAIISRYPFTHQETIFTGKAYKDNFDFLVDDTNIRNLQHATLQLPDDTSLHVLNHHGHHINQHKEGDAETMRQCAQIADVIKTLQGKVIVTGDFNLAPHSESLEQLNRLLGNLSVKHKLTTTRTALTHKTEVCDYIFVSDDITVQSFEATPEIISDHMALIVEFSV